MALKQEHRSLAIDTALGPDVLGVRSISVEERLGRLFQIEADLRSEEGEIDFDKVVGHNATIRLELPDKKQRFFNGFVSRFIQVANVGGYARYRATLVPWLWFLTRTADCRIFQAKTVPEIIEQVFKDFGFGDYQLKLSSSYATWDYCVQYRETAFNFVSRLMEQEGIYYFFEHQDGKHMLVLADSVGAHKPFPNYAEVAFHGLVTAGQRAEVVTDWTVEKEVQPVAYALNDFNFEKPKVALLASADTSRKHGAADFEIYDYPGEYVEPSDGERLAKVRLAELQSQHETLRGLGSVRGLAAGHIFKLKNHPRADQNRDYLVTGVSLRADAGEFASVPDGRSEREFFSCNFTAIDKTQQFRSARLTPKPIVQGLQTAFVAGKQGEELHVDKYGRVKVQFHWDRYGKGDENSSCWVRVAQTVAGKRWGAVSLPRIGQEVIVEFLEGDPDRPVITGRVYNAEAMPPYDLPAKATLSALKSNSSKGGAGFNEIRFEDKKGDEQVFIHGEKNVDIRVKNDTYEWVGNDRHLVVKRDKVEKVENNREEVVGSDHKEKIGKDRHLKVAGKEAKEVGDSLSLSVKGDVIQVYKANHSEQTTNDYYLKADNLVIEGMTQITIKVTDKSYLAIDASGVKIGSNKVELEAQSEVSVKGNAAVKVESPGQVEVKSATTTVKGDANLTLKGGMVMIN